MHLVTDKKNDMSKWIFHFKVDISLKDINYEESNEAGSSLPQFPNQKVEGLADREDNGNNSTDHSLCELSSRSKYLNSAKAKRLYSSS